MLINLKWNIWISKCQCEALDVKITKYFTVQQANNEYHQMWKLSVEVISYVKGNWVQIMMCYLYS